MKKLTMLVCLLIFILFSPKAFATNYYVSALTGDNANAGTLSQPFATIQYAANLTSPGDTVFIMNGTYFSSPVASQTILNITRSGTDGNYISYKAFPGHTPKIQLLSGLNYQIWRAIAVNASYIIVDGIEIEGANASLNYADAFQTWQEYESGTPDWNKIAAHNCNGISIAQSGPAHHIIIKNCKVYDAGSGIGAGNCDYITIENNLVYNNSWYTMYATSGISILDPRSIDDFTGYKIFIRNNITHNNKALIPWERINALSDGNGIILDINTGNASVPAYVGRYLVENNVSYNNGGGGVHAYRCAHVDIINNTAYNNGTVVGYPEIDANQCSDVKIYNNIMYARTGGAANGNDNNTIYDYNMYFNGPSYKNGPNDKTANPQFVLQATDAGANLQLKNTSPAINNGSNMAGQFSPFDILAVARPVGFSTDMGAYEYPTVITRPEINLKQGTINILDNNGSFDFGDVASTDPKIVTFTIQNIGDAAIDITGTPKVAVTGAGFSVTTDAPASVAANASATFEIQLSTATVGVYSGTISIANNDADENPYNFAITGYGYDGTKALQTITFNPLPVKTTGTPDFDPGASSNAGLPVSYTSSNINVATIVAGKIRLVNPGTATITAIQAGDAATNPAKAVTQLLTVTPVLPAPGVNMVSNPTFDVNTAGWSFATRNGGAATVTSVPMTGSSTNVGKVTVTNLGSTTGIDNVQLSTRVFLVKDRNYLITFKAKADAPRNITLRLLQDVSPFGTLYTVSNIGLTTTQSTYGFYAYTSTFTGYVALRFFVATNNTPVYFDDVELIEEVPVVLPIGLQSFTGSLTGNNVLLNWVTAQEENAKEFGIEKSTNGRSFFVIGTIAAKNASNGYQYSFIDYNVSEGQFFYRLKLVDKDGSFKSSKTVSLKKGLIVETGVKVFPNPVVGSCLVSYPVAFKNASLSVFRIDGKKIVDYNIVAGSTQRNVDIAGLSSGYYIMVYNNNQQTTTCRFIK